MSKKSDLKIPPQNLEAEQSVLGSLLIDSDSLMKVAGTLFAEDFYTPAHSQIYATIIDLHEKHQPVDVMSVTNRLKERDLLTNVGGAGYIADLTNKITTASHVDHYAEIVKERKILRELIKASAQITEEAFDTPEDVGSLLDSIEQKILAIGQKTFQQSFIHIKEELKGAFERIEKLNQFKGTLRGIPTGFQGIDNILSGLQKSDMIVLGARPSVGKTTFALDIARNAAKASGLPVAFFSIEMAKEQVIDRIIAAESGVSLWKLRTGRVDDTNDDWQMIQAALDRLSNVNIFVDDTPSPNILQMRSMARRLQVEHGLGLIVIDYLQLIAPRSNKSDNMVQQVTEISRGLKSLARELNVPVLALSQLSRDVDKRDNHSPKLSDLRESGSIEQDADVVILMSRARERKSDPNAIDLAGGADENLIHINIAKHRNGPLGGVDLTMDTNAVSFDNRLVDNRHPDEVAEVF
jgi:replicative DNA helicase